MCWNTSGIFFSTRYARNTFSLICTQNKAQHYARKPRAMGMPGVPYVLEYVLEYFVQEVCQEYLM